MARRRKHVQATFSPRGQALWDALAPSLDTARRILLDEACRLTDRLDALARLMAGDGETWAWIRAGRDDDAPSQLVINSAMSEARMTATVLRQIVSELSPSAANGDAVPAADGSVSDDLAKRRASRLAEAAASERPA